jgi:hypothetical protein
MIQAAVDEGPAALTSRYIARETAVSASVNAAISVGFFVAVFGFAGSVTIWGAGNFAFDFLPQTFAVTFFASLAPVLLARKAIRAGKIACARSPLPGLVTLVMRSALFAIAIMFAGAAAWTALLLVTGAVAIDTIPALAIKVAYGAALGGFVTHNRLTAILG